jgi:hypothetical protein
MAKEGALTCLSLFSLVIILVNKSIKSIPAGSEYAVSRLFVGDMLGRKESKEDTVQHNPTMNIQMLETHEQRDIL